MAKMDMVMPQMGESIAEGTILKWLKSVGDAVEKDENILEISTDKVDSEIPSPASGILVELKAGEGDVVPVGDVVAVIDTEGSGAATAPAKAEPAPAETPPAPQAAPAAPSPAQTDAPARPAPVPAAPSPAAPAAAAAPGGSEIPRRSGNAFYSPLVRSIAREEGVALEELEALNGSGRGGRITKDDLLAYVKDRGQAPAAGLPSAGAPAAPMGGTAQPTQPMAQPVPAMPVYMAPAPSGAPKPLEKYPNFDIDETRSTPDGVVDIVQMDRMRTLIAEHMVRSKATSPHVASVTEVDVTGIVRYREANKAAFKKNSGIKLTYTPFILQAAVKALLDYPMVNSTVENGQILVKRFVNMGVAVALESGLIVPVIKHAEEKNFLGMARSVDDLALRARNKQLKPDDVAGGTFTVTNMGSFGNLFGIPIINQPQSGILGVGAIVKRPVVVGDAIAIRDIMYLSLSYDHRHVDGKLGGLFIQRVRHYLENFDPASV